MKKTIIFLGILIIIGLGAYAFYKEGSLAVNKNDKSTKIFVVEKGEGLNSIINKLAKEDLIRNRVVFYLIVKQMKIETKIQAGDFRLSPSMSADTIADNLTHGTLDNWVTIPEGLRKEEIAEIISKDFNIPETEFVQMAKEGYLFPDTYLIPKTATAQDIITILENNLRKKYSTEMQQKARKLGLTDEKVIILASMLEREALFDEDRQEIASIILRRLDEGMPLQIDATVQYALGYQSQEKRWWKKTLSFEDLKINSFYNTYKNVGLPPGPISNPGFATINAVVNANPNTPYLFYLHDSSGRTHYAKDAEGHEKNIQKYLQ